MHSVINKHTSVLDFPVFLTDSFSFQFCPLFFFLLQFSGIGGWRIRWGLEKRGVGVGVRGRRGGSKKDRGHHILQISPPAIHLPASVAAAPRRSCPWQTSRAQWQNNPLLFPH